MQMDRSGTHSFKDLYPKNANADTCAINSFDTMRSLHFTCTALRTELEKSKIKLQQYAQNTWQAPFTEEHLSGTSVKPETSSMSSQQKISDCVDNVDQWNVSCSTEEMELKIYDKMECDGHQESNAGTESEPKSQDDGTSNDEFSQSREKCGDTDSETSQLNYKMKVSDQCGADTTTGDEGDEDDSTTVDDIELIFTTEDVSDLPTGMDESLVSFSDAEDQIDEDPDKENQFTKPVLLKYQQNRFDAGGDVLRDLPTQVSFEDDSLKENIAEEVKSVKAKEVKFKVSDVKKKHHRSGKKSSCTWNDSNKQSKCQDARNKQFTSFEEEYPLRPILQKSNLPKRENEAQTVITAIPKQWKSENYLAHKFSTFTTLPSKFSLPSSAFRRKQSSPATLQYNTSTSFKTPMLSDLNFTSMFPEFTRSVDRLNSCLEEENSGYYTSKQFQQTVQNTWYENIGPDHQPTPRENVIIPPTNMRRWSHHWTQDAVSKRPYPSLLRAHNNSSQYQHWSSVPTSPVRSYDHVRGSPFYPVTIDDSFYNKDGKRSSWSSLPTSPHTFQKPSVHHQNFYNRGVQGTKTPPSFEKDYNDGYKPRRKWNKVHFRGITGSLPNLSGLDGDSSGSTESLLDEADEFIRSAVDMQANTEEWETASRRRRMRRQSEPNCKAKGLKTLSSRPFIPKSVTDLKIDDVVKVIHIGGLVGVGKVSYAGIPPGKLEPYIGVELESSFGDSDGVFEGRRYFVCEPKCAVFVPFKKVILAWSAR